MLIVSPVSEEQILILSGGLTVHNLRDFSCFSEATAKPEYKAFDKAILDAVTISDVRLRLPLFVVALVADILQPAERKDALLRLTKHPGFRLSHPRADHFVPLYIAAGAGEGGDVRVLSAIHGSPTFVFGL